MKLEKANKTPNLVSKSLAFAVHLFSSLGLVAAILAMSAIAEKDSKTAMLWLFAALVVDGVDGTLARAFRVREILPDFDGKMIDTVVDFSNYAVVPAFFVYRFEVGGDAASAFLACLIVVVSAIYYGKEGMVSDDYCFVGFPVMWNMVVFYLWFVFEFGGLANAVIVAVAAVLHFVPVKFAYPSRALRLRGMTIVVTIIGLAVMPVIALSHPETGSVSKAVAIACLLYFAFIAFLDTLIPPAFDTTSKT
ncbi:MAG: hypothetical protein R2684_05895 [Pyrinomonadaceae bacterium]